METLAMMKPLLLTPAHVKAYAELIVFLILLRSEGPIMARVMEHVGETL